MPGQPKYYFKAFVLLILNATLFDVAYSSCGTSIFPTTNMVSGRAYNFLDSELSVSTDTVQSISLTKRTLAGESYIMGLVVNGIK